MGVEGSVADVAQQVPVVLRRLPAVEAPLALLAQPSRPYHGGDADMGACIVVVLPAGRAIQQVFELLHLQLLHLAVLPSVPVVVVVRCFVCYGYLNRFKKIQDQLAQVIRIEGNSIKTSRKYRLNFKKCCSPCFGTLSRTLCPTSVWLDLCMNEPEAVAQGQW